MNGVDLLPIGEVARSTGLAVSAVRYYDEIGVITASARVGGKRRFDPDTVGRVSFIRRAQEAELEPRSQRPQRAEPLISLPEGASDRPEPPPARYACHQDR